uniref:rRNA adenine N(6)-methyltransferase n=1 Tax=Parastrongyloides trichosuri TaxID=131310 RepID=A0A0N4ZNR9_PARTI
MSRLPPLPSLKDFIHMYRLRAKKILSQNYLMDMNLTRKIVRKSGRMNEAHVIEIGPGPGGITRAILENNNVKSLDVVEIDQRFIPPLQHLGEASEGRLHIHREDILKIDIMDIWKDYLSEKKSWMDVNECDNFHIIGNLPFNIASPLIIKFLKDMSYRRGAWEFGRVPLTLTFQKEVGKRICSIIDSKSRSRISIMSQYISQPEYLFEIPGSCFVPSPKVDVAVIRFIPRIEPLIPCSFELVEKIARHIFHYRQKYVVKCIKTLYPKELSNKLSEKLLIKCNIDERTTSYRLGMIDFSRICQEYERQCLEIPGLFLYDFRHNKKELKELELLENKFPPLLKHEFNRFEDGVSLSKSKEYLL